MSRKPIDQQQPSECRQAVWLEIKECGDRPFTISDIAKCVRLEVSTVRDYIIGLSKAGYLNATWDPKVTAGKRGNFSSVTYTLVRDTGHDAPRVRKDGTTVTQGQGRRHMWNTMQVVKEFSARDLAQMASTEDHIVALSEAEKYCAALCKAGYLVGRAGQRYLLILSMWTGPHPPQIQRTKQVYDPNLKRVVWAKIEGGAE